MTIAKETDLPDLLSHLGYQVRRLGSYYTTREMDSIRIKNRRSWRRYSTDQGGDAISSSQSPLIFVSACSENCVRSLAPPLPTKSSILREPQHQEFCDKTIPNAKFRIRAVDGSYGPQEFTTNGSGEIDLSMLPEGSYEVVEVECAGYVINESQRIIHLRANDTAEFVFTNTKEPGFRLVKTSADGKVSKIVDPGVYQVTEKSVPSPYYIPDKDADRTQTITLGANNEKKPAFVYAFLTSSSAGKGKAHPSDFADGWAVPFGTCGCEHFVWRRTAACRLGENDIKAWKADSGG